MTHSLTPASVAPSISTVVTPPSQKILAANRNSIVLRRDVLVGAVFGVSIVLVGDKSADAAARRPPPPPPTDKKDPNVSGVLAKVLASKKRKEAMKQSIAELRSKGKPVNQAPPEAASVTTD